VERCGEAQPPRASRPVTLVYQILRGHAAGNDPALPVHPRESGRAAPSQTLPRGEGMGKPGFPIPLRKGCALAVPGAGGNPVCPYPCLRA